MRAVWWGKSFQKPWQKMQWWAPTWYTLAHWLADIIYIYIYTQQPATASSLPFNSFFTPVLRKTSMATPLAQMRDAASEDAWKARVFMWKKSPVDSWFIPCFFKVSTIRLVMQDFCCIHCLLGKQVFGVWTWQLLNCLWWISGTEPDLTHSNRIFWPVTSLFVHHHLSPGSGLDASDVRCCRTCKVFAVNPSYCV